MEYAYPLLQKICAHYSGVSSTQKISELRLFSCQHVLEPQYKMYKELIAFGFRPSHITILAKAYSSNKEIINDLIHLGINVIHPQFSGVSFDEEHRANCKMVVEKISNKNKNIILDDGGCLIYEAKDTSIFFAVEQTSSGLRKIESLDLSFPVFNVARSRIKLSQESPHIAKLIFRRLIQYCSEKKITHPNILIVGLGAIGGALLRTFINEGFNVAGFDTEKNKVEMLSYLTDKKPDIVIGATGTTLFNVEDLEQLVGEHVYYFVSVSSSDREFPVVPFRKNNQIHCDVRDRNFIFVNNGFPITFKGNRYESLPVEIEKTIGLLLGSVMHGSVYEMSDLKGIQEIPKELEALFE